MRKEDPTPTEKAFFERLRVHIGGLQDWYHADPDGTQWMTVSYDDVVDERMQATWRLDFDGRELVAGRSPAHLNWDDGIRGRETGMDFNPPEGMVVQVATVVEAVQHAALWFDSVTQGRAARH